MTRWVRAVGTVLRPAPTVNRSVAFDHRGIGTSVAVPSSMAALGDSISGGFNACSRSGECLSAVWSTGSDTGVDSCSR